MAKKAKNASAATSESDRVVVLTPSDIAKALRDIAGWVESVRAVIVRLPADTKIIIPKSPKQKDHRIDDGCPPPE